MQQSESDRKGRLRGAAVAAAAIAAGTVALVVAAPGAAGTVHVRSAQASATTVHVIEHAITDKEIATLAGKDAKGNILTFNNPVYDTTNKTKVGHDEGFCTRVAPRQHIWECLWTTFLKGGQITVQGPYYDNRNSVLSITGGTGSYDGARGQMTLNSRDKGAEYDFIFALS